MTNPDYLYDLTFGVELEFVFVFHEKLILGQLKHDYAVEKGGGSPLQNGRLLEGDDLAHWRDLFLRKDLSAGERYRLRQGAPQYIFANPQYLSWGIQIEASPGPERRPIDRFEGVQSSDEDGVRTYATEPLEVASEVIRSNGAFDYWTSSRHHSIRDVNVYDGTREQKPLTDFRLWHLTNDFSLSALRQGALDAYLRSYKVCPRRDGVRPFTNREVPMDILNSGEAVPEGFEAPEMENMIDFTEQPTERTIHGLNEIPVRSSEKTDASVQATRGSSRDLRESAAETTGETTEEEAERSSGKATRGSSGNTREGTAETTGETTEEEAGASDTILGKRSRSPEEDDEEDDDKENRARPRKRGSGTGQPRSSSTDAITRSQLGYSSLTATGSGQSSVAGSHIGQSGTTVSHKSETPMWEGPPWLGERKTGLPDLREWDSYGIELVSPVLDVEQPAFDEINELCNTLKGQPCHDHGATINTTCGLHIHLKPRNAEFDLPTLKHLAYILVMYEVQIETLHPRYRRTNDGTDRTNFDHQSNINNLIFGDVDRRSLREIRELIANIGDFRALEAAIGRGKGFIVNFSNLLRLRDEDGPKTLEFRQHEGVLRGEMVGWWVGFCVGLLHLATSMAHNGMTPTGIAITDFEAQCRAYPFQKWDAEEGNTDIRSNLSVWDLFDLMNFPLDERAYFQRRAAYFAPDYDGRMPIPAPASASTDSDYPDDLDNPDALTGQGTSAGPGTSATSSTASGPDTGLETLVPSTYSWPSAPASSGVIQEAMINTQVTLLTQGIPQDSSAANSSVNLPETIPETQGAGHNTPPQRQNAQSSSVNLPGTIPETPRAGFYIYQDSSAATSSFNLPETIPETQGADRYTFFQTLYAQSSSVNSPQTSPETPGAGHYTHLQTPNAQSSSVNLPGTIPETP